MADSTSLNNNTQAAKKPDLRGCLSHAVRLLRSLFHHGLAGMMTDETAALLDRSDELLQEVEVSRPGELPDVARAMGAIERMRHGEPIAPDDIHAIVELAELGAQELASVDLRWRADMRAVERWRAGDDLHPLARYLMERAAKAIPDQGLAVEINAMLAERSTASRELILPDHADMTVWLLQCLDRSLERSDWPSIESVEGLCGTLDILAGNTIERLNSDLAAKGQPATTVESTTAHKAAVMMRQLAEALIVTDRRLFMLEHRPITAAWDMAAGPDMSAVVACRAIEDDEARSAALAKAVEMARDLANVYANGTHVSRDGYLAASAFASELEALVEPASPAPASRHLPLGHPRAPIAGGRARPVRDIPREELEANVNRFLVNSTADAGAEYTRRDIGGVVAELAPGWAYQEAPPTPEGAPQIALVADDGGPI